MRVSRGRCRLQEWLDVRGLTQVQFAARTGLSTRMVSYYCTDTRPMTPEAQYLACKALHIHMEDLYEWIEH